ncbi:hypothetical protein CROQUDRAFT_51288 [Cronartium quercuum f. sp. fusiforme G11]|uniref:Uncharacterized protein n=1 Tax=Cronartium quercuum f. sp. fusiforme G11 TaxID=708437 RepID=A0A9P6NDF8_9BASI|nr:hypothetical protein CROQUDRAFT_51288 [Cronartium quercuum f. sp. fusiforme G11]
MKIVPLQELLQRSPPNTNPFQFVHDLIARVLLPRTPNCAAPALVFFGIVYGANILVCLAILIIPLHRGPTSRKKYQSPWQVHHIPESTTPYYIPNSGLCMAVFQLITCVISEIYVAMMYYSAKSQSFQRATYALVWVEIRWLPMYLGVWATAWASFAFCLCTSERTLYRSLHLNPLVFNSLCFLFATALFTLAVYYTVRQLTLLTSSYAQHDIFFKNLHLAIDQWNRTRGKPLPEPTLINLERTYESFVNSVRVSMAHTRSTILFWTICAIPIFLVYAVSVWAFLTLVRGCTDVATGKISVLDHCKAVIEPGTKDQDISSDLDVKCNNTDQITLSGMGNYLKRKYIYLATQSSCLSLCLCFHIAVGIFRLAAGDKVIYDGNVRAAVALLNFGGSCFIFLAMTIQCYHMVTDKKGERKSEILANEERVINYPIQVSSVKEKKKKKNCAS